MLEKKTQSISGSQTPYTGMIGACFILGLIITFAIYQKDVHILGGSPIRFSLAWLGVSLPFETINRDYFDVLTIVFLGFQLMVCWEFSGQRFRLLTILAGICTLYFSWSLTHKSLQLSSFFTAMEWLYIGHFGVITLLFLIDLFQKKMPIQTQPFLWSLNTAFVRWIAGLIPFYFLLRMTFYLPFYQDSFYENWRITLTYLFFTYFVLGFPYGLITNTFRPVFKENRSDPLFTLMLIYHGVWRVFHGQYSTLRVTLNNRRVRIVLRDLMVKLFFIPLMITFLFNESGRMFNNINNLRTLWTSQNFTHIFQQFYLTAYSSIFMMDVSLALIGYLCASRWLNNKSISVDATWTGWIVTLICYPPFNEVMNTYLPYGQSYGQPYAFLQYEWLDISLKVVTLMGLSLYVFATMSFGLRFSNLTHRGIITRGPYALIRHPAYIGKNIAWWAESIRSFASPVQFIFLGIWNLVYFFRAMTEERHLNMDETYRAYCAQVKYRFIPGIF